MQLARMDCLTSLISCQKAARHPVPAASFTVSHCSTSLLRPSRMSVTHTYVNKSFKRRGGRRRKSPRLVIVASANGTDNVLVLGEERRKKITRSKRILRETKAAVAAAVSCPTALLVSEDQMADDLEGVAAVLELTYKDSLTAALESAYKQQSVLELPSSDLRALQYNTLSSFAPSNRKVSANHIHVQVPKKRRTKLSKAAAAAAAEIQLNTEKLEALRKPDKKILLPPVSFESLLILC